MSTIKSSTYIYLFIHFLLDFLKWLDCIIILKIHFFGFLKLKVLIIYYQKKVIGRFIILKKRNKNTHWDWFNNQSILLLFFHKVLDFFFCLIL